MRQRKVWTAIAIVLLLAASPSLAGGNANFLIGSRALDEDFWEPLEQQGVFGVTVDFGKEGWPVNLAIGVYGSGTTEEESNLVLGDTDVTGAVGELSFGVLKAWSPKGSFHPYVGGGLASVGAAAEIDTQFFGDDDDHDSSLGVYIHGGVFWRLGSRFNLGVDARSVLGTKITLFGEEGDADYFQLGLLLGWGWPASR